MYKMSRSCWFVLVFTLLWIALFSWLTVVRYEAYNDGMSDLDTMAQSIWTATQGLPLVHTAPHIGPRSRLNVHVELIYYLFAPFYALWPDPRLLLIIQAALFGLGGLPLYALAQRKLQHTGAALMMVGIYLLYPVAQTAVLFGFHGDTLAMPLLLFAIESLDRRAWRWYVLWLILSLSCKFYIGVPVAALGLGLWVRGERRVGLWTALTGLGWTIVAFLVIRPLFAPAGAEHTQSSILGYIYFFFGGLFDKTSFATVGTRLLNFIIVLGPTMWLGWRVPVWQLPAMAIVVPVLLSSGPGPSYLYRWHHYASAVPFLVVAILYGAVDLQQRQLHSPATSRHYRRSWYGEIFLTLGTTLIFSMGLVNTPLSPGFWTGHPGFSLDPLTYGRTSRDILKDSWLLPQIPSCVSLAASPFMTSHFANRLTLYQTNNLSEDLSHLDYVLSDALFDYPLLIIKGQPGGSALHDVPVIARLLRDPTFGLISAQDGLLLFQQHPPVERVLAQRIEILSVEGVEPQARFDDAIGLVKVRIQPLSGRRFRLRYDWVSLRLLDGRPSLVAVSRLAGVSDARIVHLPTETLQPTTTWKMGQVVREEFEIELPADIPAGRYELWTGWYDSQNFFAFATDARSRVGEEIQVGVLELP